MQRTTVRYKGTAANVQKNKAQKYKQKYTKVPLSIAIWIFCVPHQNYQKLLLSRLYCHIALTNSMNFLRTYPIKTTKNYQKLLLSLLYCHMHIALYSPPQRRHNNSAACGSWCHSSVSVNDLIYGFSAFSLLYCTTHPLTHFSMDFLRTPSNYQKLPKSTPLLHSPPRPRHNNSAACGSWCHSWRS